MTLPDPSLERSFSGHKSSITCLSFNPNQKQLASSSLDNTVICYNFKPGSRAYKFIGHKGPVYSVDFHPNGNILASGSSDHCIKLWTPNAQGNVTSFKAHVGSVRSVSFSSSGTKLLSCSDDKSLKIWSSQRAKFQYSLCGHTNWVRAAKFSVDDRLIISGSDDKTVKLWDTNSKSCIKTYFEHTGCTFHPSGHLIVSCSSDRSIRMWDIRTHKLIQYYPDAHGREEGLNGVVNSVNIGGKSGEWLLSTGGDGLVKIWDLHEGHLFYTLYGHKHPPTTAAVFSEDENGGTFFASASADAQVLVWKANFNLDNFDFPALETEDEKTNKVSSSFANNIEKKGKSMGKEPIEIAENFSQSNENNKIHKSKQNTIGHGVESIVESFDPERKPHYTEEPLTNYLGPVSSTLPEISATLQQVVKQLDILTKTMAIIDERVSNVEDRIMMKKEDLNYISSQYKST